ncbi:hypothetical protein EDC96DRAFT_580906 [Choanephora cucurbitarum]|nr:hypothetical protein EDC96DRAFT_580906 [Choanephora cucurbitarum]
MGRNINDNFCPLPLPAYFCTLDKTWEALGKNKKTDGLFQDASRGVFPAKERSEDEEDDDNDEKTIGTRQQPSSIPSESSKRTYGRDEETRSL